MITRETPEGAARSRAAAIDTGRSAAAATPAAAYILGEIENLRSALTTYMESAAGPEFTEIHEQIKNLFAMTTFMSGPFHVTPARDALYPQYDIVNKLIKWRASPEVVRWLADQARANLSEDRGASEVRAHWRRLATADPGE